jgi:hypothetical protein
MPAIAATVKVVTKRSAALNDAYT